jgi:DNA-binding PadR family transcriptional regulator
LSNDELRLFSYEILGLVGSAGAGTHDLRRMVKQGRMLDWAGESQYYSEPKRLAALGYLEARKEPGKTRDRTVYTLTAKGLAALREWAATPVAFTPVKSELLLRLLVADLVGEEVTRAGVLPLRGELDELLDRVREMEASAELLPHRRAYLLLVADFLRGLLALHAEVVDEVARATEPGAGAQAGRQTPGARGQPKNASASA